MTGEAFRSRSFVVWWTKSEVDRPAGKSSGELKFGSKTVNRRG